MTIETGIENAGAYINSLDDTYPAGGDDLVEGDNHIRGIKNTLLNTFANVTGAVTATHTQLNAVASTFATKTLASSDDVIDNFPSGTLMLFQQTAAPTGWTKQTTHDNKALRVVSGTASNGGSVAFSTAFGKTATDAHTLTLSQIPSHNHGGGSHGHVANVGSAVGATTNIGLQNSTTGTSAAYIQSSGTIISSQGSGASHTHNMDIRVQYVDFIIASKD